MKKIIVSILVICLLLTTSVASVNAVACKRAIFVDDDAPPGGDGTYNHPFQTIQEGIDNADDGDVVFVFSGIYNENLVVDKSINLIGEEEEEMCIINGDGIRNVVNITANWININGFKIIGDGCEYGIYVIADNVTISHNHISENIFGIYLDESTDSTLFMNNVTENYGIGIKKGFGIHINNSRFVDVLQNNISKSHSLGQFGDDSKESGIGLYIENSENITIEYNDFFGNYGICEELASMSYSGIGLFINHSKNIIIEYNDFFGNYGNSEYGYSGMDYSGIGLSMKNSENITIEYNDFFGNYGNSSSMWWGYSGIGLDIKNSKNTTIEYNNIFENYGNCEDASSVVLATGIGIIFAQSDNNNIRYNNIYSNYQLGSGFCGGTGMAIAFSSSDYNNVSYNNIYDNIGKAYLFDLAIELQGSHYNDFYCNNIYENGGDALLLNFANNNNIIKNDITGNSGNGLNLFYGGNDNNVMNNNITGNSGNGLRILQSDDNQIKFNNISENSENGIHIASINYGCSEYNVASHNIISRNSGNGIQLDRDDDDATTRYNKLLNNEIFENSIGIRIANYSNNNEVRNNSIRENSNYGIDISSSCYSNVLYHNNLVSNVNQANDAGTNVWDNGNSSGGNYWDDYTGNDSNGDGIGDTPYFIPGGENEDSYPFMNPDGWLQQPENIVYVDDDALLEWYDETHVRTIQEGINNVSSCGIVYVFNGIYHENVVVNKTVDLIGENKNNTIIDGGGNGDVVVISANETKISSFTIQNSGSEYNFPDADAGIDVRSNYNIIVDNMIENDFYGVYIYYTYKNNTVSDNSILNNYNGIVLRSSWSNNIIGNYLTNTTNTAIYLKLSQNNNVISNIVENQDWCGIQLCDHSSNNIIRNNYIKNSFCGIDLSFSSSYNVISSNNLESNDINIDLSHSSDNIISENNVINGGNGIYVGDYCENNNIFENSVISNSYGIHMNYGADNNLIYNNNVINNDYGIYIIHYTNDNNIYHNNFIDNNQNAIDHCDNTWDDGYPSGGNYWDDYTGNDTNGDGIGDTPYPIPSSGNEDRYPLMVPWGENPPVADYTYSIDNLTVTFDASLSYDRDGIIILYQWDFGDETNETGKTVEHTYFEPGIYEVILTIIDDDAHSSNTSKFINIENKSPNAPSIDGPTSGTAGEEHDYTFTAVDPDGDDIFLWIEWGDGTVEQDGWIGPYNSGEEITIGHTWDEQGTYEIRAKAKDIYGAEGNWSDPFSITMPLNQISAKSVAVMKSIQTMPSPTMNGMKLLR